MITFKSPENFLVVLVSKLRSLSIQDKLNFLEFSILLKSVVVEPASKARRLPFWSMMILVIGHELKRQDKVSFCT